MAFRTKKNELAASLNPWDSLRFLWDPQTFLAKGRFLGGPWGNWGAQLGKNKVIVISDPKMAEIILHDSRFELYDAPIFGPFMGDVSTLLTEGELHEEARKKAKEFANKLRKSAPELQENLTQAIQTAAQKGNEIGQTVRFGLIEWAIEAVIAEKARANFSIAVQLAMCWLENADTHALFIPPLRFLPKWQKMKWVKALLITALGYDDEPLLADQALTILVGVADNPVALALESLRLGQEIDWITAKLDPDYLVGQTLKNHPPIPFILRQALEDVEIAGLKISKGSGVAFDARFVQIPFGKGTHYCLGPDLGRMVAKTVMEAFPWKTYLFVEGPRGRVRLTVGLLSGVAWPKDNNLTT